MEIKETIVCKFCDGRYRTEGWCPYWGLKFRNSFCVKETVRYVEVKVRNNVPMWKFWKDHYTIEKIIIP